MIKELILFFILSTVIVLSKALFIPSGSVTNADNNPSKLTEFISPIFNNDESDLDTAETNFRSSYSGWRYGNGNGFGNYIPGSYTQFGIPISQSSLNLPIRGNLDGFGSWPGYYGGNSGYVRPGWQGK